MDLKEFVREIPDFPRPGIGFKDITPLLLTPTALDAAVERLAAFGRALGVDLVVAAEARGFILGGALARELGAGFVPARKPGKLPYETISVEYALEYGLDELHLHADALAGGTRVLIHDDLLATGGTAKALCQVVEETGAEIVGCGFVVELGFLNGRAQLEPYRVDSLIEYAS
jgi:adenine phosphoribosyltransferase